MSAPALRSYRYWTVQYRRTWRSGVFAGVLSPVLFLASLGLGLGGLVDSGSGSPALGTGSYRDFLAPGLLAATAMQAAAAEATYPVLGSVKWTRNYQAMVNTPLTVGDVVAGHLLWMATKVAILSVIFLAVMAAFGTLAAGTWPLALPAAVLTGMAFAAPLAALSVGLSSDSTFNIVNRFVVVPLFLFSGTFFPVTQLPRPLELAAECSPLYQGVRLCRGLVLGGLGPLEAALRSLALLAVTAAGTLWARRRFAARLTS